MGYGFPSAIGAQIGCPDAIVFDIAGDGSIQMNIQELATAVLNEVPVNIAVLNNGYLGMVRQWQELFYGRRYAMTCLREDSACPDEYPDSSEQHLRLVPDFVKLAEAYGAVGIRVTKPKEVLPAIEKAIESAQPCLLDFIVAREENVFPMVPAGASLRQMMSGMA